MTEILTDNWHLYPPIQTLDNVLPDQFQTVAAVLPSDWAEKHKSFLAPIRSQNSGDRLELVW